jgi:hypothetical protein
MAEGGKKHKHGSSGGGAGGFKALGLTEDVFRGVVRLGFKVRLCALRNEFLIKNSHLCICSHQRLCNEKLFL